MEEINRDLIKSDKERLFRQEARERPEETAFEAASLGRAFHAAGTGCAFSKQREGR